MKLRLLTLSILLSCYVQAIAQVSQHIAADAVHGVNAPTLSLNGTWNFQFSPQSKWSTIQVPGEAVMQGYAIEHGKPIFYRRQVAVPSDFAGKSIFLRFDGVYSKARLWVNGKYVAQHAGGFTRWEVDLTNIINVGRKNEIKVEVIDPIDDISYASGYAHHPIGGILRDVTIYALPKTAISNLVVKTDLDSLYRHAKLEIAYQTLDAPAGSSVDFQLLDAKGNNVPLAASSKELKQGQNNHSFAVVNPAKWDAEHPNLYTLRVVVSQQGSESYRFDRKIGFREVEVVGDKMLVNGLSVKLRGACRHDVHPTLGRTTTRELDSLDVKLFKESNMNYIRTSHYPPSEAFVEFCDRYGLYIECETAVCFVNTHAVAMFQPVPTQSDSNFTAQYLSQCQEMFATFASSPAVVIWSVGNESIYGSNFQMCYDWMKKNDATRPVMFSYPGSVKAETKVYDILSMHYQDAWGNLWQYGMSTNNFQTKGIPTIFDEWAHPACYTYQTLREDPNIREFWGRSIDMMWSGLFESSGGLGGAIWSYIDETFMPPHPKVGTNYWNRYDYVKRPKDPQGHCTGYGEWGIVDVWRRHKPEFWSTKKAYSPVKLLETQINDVVSQQKLILPVYNRFDHTNLNETKLRYTYNGETKTIAMPSIAPRQKGTVVIENENWKNETQLFVEFISANGDMIDAEMVRLGGKSSPVERIVSDSQKLTVENTNDYLIVRGDGFEVPIDLATGMIVNAKSGQNVVINGGPFVYMDINLNHLSGAEVRKSADKFYTHAKDWKLKSMEHKTIDGVVHLFLKGSYAEVSADIQLSVFANGKIVCNYSTEGEPNGFLREIGLRFDLPQAIDSLEWDRKGYWSYYPENSFAANSGRVSLYQSKQSLYGERPVQPWHDDTHNYFYWADRGANCDVPLTQQAKGMKENIYSYALSGNQGASKLVVTSKDASIACRLYKTEDEQLSLYVNNRWDYPEIAWGNYCKKLEVTPVKGSVTMWLR